VIVLNIIYREIQESDAEQFYILQERLDKETTFMMMEPGERQSSIGKVLERIKKF